VSFNWANHKRHREYVVKRFGQWVGLLDENGVPLMDLPNAVTLTAPSTRTNPESMKVTIKATTPDGVPHPVVEELIGEEIGMENGGYFIPQNGATRIVVVERANGYRWAGKVKFTTTTGDAFQPHTITINALHVLDVLGELPCPAANKSWLESKYETYRRDPAAVFDKARELSLLTFADTADGFSEKGEAEALLRRVISRAIEVVSTHEGWEKPHVVVDNTASGKPSPVATIRITDDSIWDTVAETALLAGVSINANFFFPGDTPINGVAYEHPVIVITLRQVGDNE